jgi:tetratricopeptide (TPR) repeat protein
MALCWAGWRLYVGRQLQPGSSTSTAAPGPAAAAQFRTALQLDPRNVDALVNLALAQRDGRQLEVAKETLLAALTGSPRNAAAHYNLAQLYDQTNEAARAADHYRKFSSTPEPSTRRTPPPSACVSRRFPGFPSDHVRD